MIKIVKIVTILYDKKGREDIGITAESVYQTSGNQLYSMQLLAGIEAANYPFATIDPNVGVVGSDERLNKLTELVSPKRLFQQL